MSALPSGWTEATVDQLASDEPAALTDGPFGSNLKTSHYTAEGPRVIRLQNIGDGFFVDEKAHISPKHFDRLRKYEARAGDVVIAMLGETLPRACILPTYVGPAIVKADCVRLRIHPRLAAAPYVAAALNSHQVRRQASDLVHGVGRPRLGLKWLRTLRIPFAPLAEQTRIVDALESYLTRVDDSIATLERIKQTLMRYRASVLKAAVEGHLVPTEAELARAEGRDFEPASVLLERILDERRIRWREAEFARMKARVSVPTGDRWKAKYQEPTAPETSGLPALPEGWCWASMDQLGDVSGGITKNAKRDTLPLQLPYLRVANVYANELRLDVVRRIGLVEAEVERVLLQRGDLLVVEGNGSLQQIGRVALWDGSISPCVHQNHLIKVRLSAPGLAEWSLSWLLAPAGRRAIERVASSTSGLHTLSLSKVAALPVPLPPAAEQARITQEVDRLTTVQRSIQSDTANQALRSQRLRQAILRWALEGKLVEQNPADEPAHVLLARTAAERGGASAHGAGRREGRLEVPKTTPELRSLIGVLQEAGGRLSPEQLFLACGYSEETVGAFYQALAAEIKAARIAEVRPRTREVELRLEKA